MIGAISTQRPRQQMQLDQAKSQADGEQPLAVLSWYDMARAHTICRRSFREVWAEAA
jgi:hypothetical protein